ncbi:alpha/beta hydrolase [Curtobacterium sp. VKM Ac-2865]|uniref:alpha/beta hydrolase family protein n=1 Tax=Curtobacterium sp. VKM Ac-2865 TaxID=2783817 RepID=UPI00188C89D0|nr:alpha/beta hydrolase [Curtobacterium sp. VKM Ac-2865]MBF4583300.1 alpha/beta hydrolase [Curtobacterium sp. VKM Ac-2865]
MSGGVVVAVLVVLLVVVVLLGLLVVVRRVVGRVVLPGQERWTPVLAVDASSITLPLSDETLSAGTFGLWHGEGEGEGGDAGAGVVGHAVVGRTVVGHTVVGPVLDVDEARGTVRRAVLDTVGAPPTEVRWTGHALRHPSVLGTPWNEVAVPTALGPAPAWQVSPPADDGTTASRTWAVHVHGIRTTRVTALRTVPAATALGWTSLVPSFRGDGEAPSDARASHLGAREWPDVEAALDHAVAHSAERLVLVGWSMGATITRELLVHSAHRARIVGLVLVAPALDWATTVQTAAARSGLPDVVVRLALGSMATPGTCRLVGLRSPVDVRALSWVLDPSAPPLDHLPPTLVVHSPGDPTVPFRLSEQFAAQHPGVVTLAVSEPTGHGWERNRDAAWFDAQVTGWGAALD